jgi:hypothetical protein
MMGVIRYVCEGSCQGKVTEDEHKEGKTTCGTKDCENYGQPLVRREYCSRCNTVYEEGDHVCMG